MGKLVVVGAVALLLGLFVGGLAPRAELRRVQAELAEARLAASRRGSAAALPLALGVGSLVAAQRQAASATGRPAPAAPGRTAPPPRFVNPGPAGGEGGDAGAGRRFDPQALAAAKAGAELRAAQFRAAFIEQAQLGPQGQAALGEAVNGMNSELGRMADEVAAELESRPKLRPRDMADLGAKVLDIYRRQDDRFKAGLDERGRQALDRTDFDLLTQVDLGAFERLAERLSTMDVPSGPERR